jgi:hypothetical protein
LKNCSQTCWGGGRWLNIGTSCHSHMKPRGNKAKKLMQFSKFTQLVGQDRSLKGLYTQ